MKTGLLLAVPKMGKTKAERISVFKTVHGIWTHRVPFARKDHPWSALLVPAAREALSGYGVTQSTLVEEMISGYCRLLDEWNLLVTGEGELSAIRTLCEANDIQCDL